MYETLKKRILEEFADTTQAKITQLLGTLSLGDRKPSQLLAKMRAKAANTPVQDELLKELWQRNLPEQVRAIVSSSDLSLAQAASMADRVAEALRPRNADGISTISPSTDEDTSYQLSQMQQQIDEILRQLKDNKYGSQQRSRSNVHSNRGRDRTPKRTENDQAQQKRTFENCWWHFKYGQEARKCKPPCSFHNSNRAGCYDQPRADPNNNLSFSNNNLSFSKT